MRLKVRQRAIINSAMDTEALQIQTCQQVKAFFLNGVTFYKTNEMKFTVITSIKMK